MNDQELREPQQRDFERLICYLSTNDDPERRLCERPVMVGVTAFLIKFFEVFYNMIVLNLPTVIG